NPLVQRATRGKLAKFNFGATLHRVVRLDLASGVFVPQQATLRPQWETRLPLLLEQLVKAPAVLRVAYMAETEDAALVEARVKAVKREIAKRWAAAGSPYELSIETEVFWRTGAPPARRAAP
ncbi:MAG: Translocon-associated protein beta, partial [Moraxellaceae bacterium]|nr:Translocon-associated protein beta [Moraxellaceae bacterium]